MNPLELFNQVKEMIEKKDFEAAKTFVEDNKDNLGEYFDQAYELSTLPLLDPQIAKKNPSFNLESLETLLYQRFIFSSCRMISNHGILQLHQVDLRYEAIDCI